MERDKSHIIHLEQWAKFVKTHSRKEWKKHIKPFIDAQIKKANMFLKELCKTKEGEKKVKRLLKTRRISERFLNPK